MRSVPAWLAACAFAAASALAAEELVDGIAAQVGGEIVLVSEVMQTVAQQEARARAAGIPELEIAKLRADGLEQLIEWRLIEMVVRQTELYASDDEIDKTIESIASENGITTAQLEASVSSQGLTLEDYRETIKRELERRKVVNTMVASRIRVEEGEVKALYQERFAEQPDGGTTFHVRQLLVAFGGPTERDPEVACNQVREAHRRISEGDAFEAIAREISDVAPRQGGDIGWLHESQLAPWMSAAVNALSPGETSEVIELAFGCCLLKLVERRDFVPITFEKARPVLEQELFQEKVGEEFTEWMEKLREKTYIERHGYFADAARLQSELTREPTEEEAKEEEEPILP